MRVESTSSRAFSPVISAVILSAVVIAVGGAIWAFSQGAMTIPAEDYAEGVVNMTDVISERFIIEMVSYNKTRVTAEAVETGNDVETIFYLDNSLVVSGSEAIYLDELVQTKGVNYTIDYATGNITFSEAPATGVAITADYKYTTNPLRVWIFNYGTVDIEVKVQVKDVTCPAAKDDWIEIPSNDMMPFPTITLDPIWREELNVMAYTKRGNNAYYKYVVP